MRLLFYFLFFCSSSFNVCYAQVIRSFDDDLVYIKKYEKEIIESQSDSVKAYICFKLSIMYKLANDSTQSRNYLNQGVKLSKGNPFLNAAFYYFNARIFNFDKAQVIEHNLKKGDSLLQKFENKEAYSIRGSIWYYYSILQQNKGNESGAVEIILNKALPYAQKSENYYLLGTLQNAIAISLMNNNQLKKAQPYLLKASSFFEKPQDSPRRLSSLVSSYIDAAENYVALGTYDSGKIQLNKAQSILLSRPETNLNVSFYYVQGLYYDGIKQYSQALISFDKGINFPNANPFHLAQLKYGKYHALSHSKDYKNALVVLKDLLKNHSIFVNDKKNYYKGLLITYAKLGNIQEAYKWSEQYITLSDSLYEARYQNDVAELEAKYNKAENQKKIATLQAEKEKAELTSKSNRLLATLLGTISFFLLITATFGWMYYRDNKKLSEQKEVNYQQKLKEAEQQQQMQYAKALLQGEEKERKRLAGDLHDGLGGMLARVKINLSKLVTHNHEPTMTPDLNKVIDQLDNSVNELRRIARNMMPESLVSLGLEAALTDMCTSLTSDTTHVNFQAFDISHSIAKDIQSTIYRIVQELLTNAIRHAKASQIVVQCSQNENTFFITVEDNGIGFNTKTIDLKKGIGLANVKSRVDYLGGKMDIASALGDGTTINIELNVIS